MSETFDYDEMALIASQQIAYYGQPATLRVPGTATGADPWNPTPGTATDVPCTVVVTDYRASERDGTIVRVTDRRALISVAGLAVEPGLASQLVLQTGEVFAVVAVSPLSPGGTPLLYDMQVRS
jgi:hypothetical protein